MGEKNFVDLGKEVGELLRKKNAAYGNAFEESEKVLKVLFPSGVSVEKYRDFLTITRIIDKLFRIATDKDAFSEDPWRDIAGYAILSLWSQQPARRGIDLEEERKSRLAEQEMLKEWEPKEHIRKRISDELVCVSDNACNGPNCEGCQHLRKEVAYMSDGTTQSAAEVRRALDPAGLVKKANDDYRKEKYGEEPCKQPVSTS
jgi:hypothetical protein